MTTNKTNNANLLNLTEKLKREDTRYAQISKRFQIVYWVLVVVYITIIIIDAVKQASVIELAGSTCFLLAMLIFAVFFRHYSKEYNKVDYALPTLLMLKQAAYRYRPFDRKQLWVLMAILLSDAGLTLGKEYYVDVIWVHIGFLGAVLVGVLIGLAFWYTRYKPLRDGALQLISDIETNE